MKLKAASCYCLPPYCILLANLLFACILFSHPTVYAGEISIAIGMSLPPYAMEEKNSGMEVEIIREAFKIKGHSVVFNYVPNLRIPMLLKDKKVDGIAVNSSYDVAGDIKLKVFRSETTLFYQNCAISLTERHLNMNSIEDLADKSVIAFNNATKYLGQEFASMASKNKQYKETSDQAKQVINIYMKDSEVAVSDKNIFLYWKNVIGSRADFQQPEINNPIVFSPIFPPSPRNCAFIDETLRNEFDDGLKRIHHNGVYDLISDKYEKLYSIK